MKRAAVLGVIAASVLAMAPAASGSVPTGRTCKKEPICEIEIDIFPGGTLSIDADAHGTGRASWAVDHGMQPVCSTGFDAAAPPQSWVCHNVPAGHLRAVVSGGSNPLNIGLRW